MKQINIKYGVGDAIIFRVHDTKVKLEVCGCCEGSGKIIGKDGVQYNCPKCRSEGKIFVNDGVEVIEKEGTISSVHVRWDSNNYTNNPEKIVYYNVPNHNQRIYENDIVQKIVSDEEKMGYTE